MKKKKPDAKGIWFQKIYDSIYMKYATMTNQDENQITINMMLWREEALTANTKVSEIKKHFWILCRDLYNFAYSLKIEACSKQTKKNHGDF